MKRRNLLATALVLGSLGISSGAWAGASAYVNQTGDYNYTKVIQKGDKTVVREKTMGQYTYPSVLARAEMKAMGLGRNNRRQVVKCGVYAQGGPGGTGARALQAGAGNRAVVNQAGSGNTASVSQNGTGNASYTYQVGNDMHAETVQSGNYNIATIVQRC